MDILENLFVSFYHSLLTLQENNYIFYYNNETSAKSASLFKLIDDFEFIVTFVITCKILDYLLPATRKLQSKDVDTTRSTHVISSLKLFKTLEQMA